MAAVLLGLVGLPGTLQAQEFTHIRWEVSPDNVVWSNTLPSAPGTTVFARAMVSYAGTMSPNGLGSMVFQPVVSGWGAGNSTLPWAATGGNTTTPVGTVPADSATLFGRVAPWGRSAIVAQSAITSFVHVNPVGAPAGTYLRVASANAPNWIGQGAGSNNVTGALGIQISQFNSDEVGRTIGGPHPAFVPSLSNIIVFKMAFNLSQDPSPLVTIGSPVEGFGNYDSTTGERYVRWFGNTTETTGSILTTPVVTPATIFLPAPASAGLVGLGLLTVIRRRRLSTPA